jgi:ABC-2 type transport system ATP-binding protein
MSLLEIKEVSKTYGSHVALNEVSLEVPAGSIYGLLGPNGAGKTSLIRIVNQITGPDSGAVFFEGEPLAQRHVAQIGYLPEERGLYPKMKVGEQLFYLAQLKGLSKEEAKRRLKEWFERLEITDWWDKKIESLSKGMAQKVQFVSTVLHQPKLLIFDEPFTGFDPINTNIIKSEIQRLAKEGATVIFSTHRMESVEEICEYIALINKSNKVLEGKLKDVKDAYRTNTFLAEVESQQTISSLASADLLEQTDMDGLKQLKFRLKAHDTKGILAELNQHGMVTRFEEVIPSLNEIFIQKVGEHA